ncbi:MAG: ATP-binding protein [Lachnospiraceae bacterium]|nr:ATP-binding protein [Lachnospiraceae bacterium]
MLPEISLNVLDVVQNSIRANAQNIKIKVERNTRDSILQVTIEDDGCGMDEEQIKAVYDPFYTSRTTRKVGLGIPFFKQAAELAGGWLKVESTPDVGTVVRAEFHTDNIDCMPVGNMNDTIHALVTMNEDIDFEYECIVDGRSFVLDTREMKEILGDVSFKNPEVSEFIRSYLSENETEILGNMNN